MTNCFRRVAFVHVTRPFQAAKRGYGRRLVQRVMHKESVGEDARSCARNVRNSNRCKRGTDRDRTDHRGGGMEGVHPCYRTWRLR
eukprot:scaffold21158_cov62-Phaeocystis_antarctica.AAC.7